MHHCYRDRTASDIRGCLHDIQLQALLGNSCCRSYFSVHYAVCVCFLNHTSIPRWPACQSTLRVLQFVSCTTQGYSIGMFGSVHFGCIRLESASTTDSCKVDTRTRSAFIQQFMAHMLYWFTLTLSQASFSTARLCNTQADCNLQ